MKRHPQWKMIVGLNGAIALLAIIAFGAAVSCALRVEDGMKNARTVADRPI